MASKSKSRSGFKHTLRRLFMKTDIPLIHYPKPGDTITAKDVVYQGGKSTWKDRMLAHAGEDEEGTTTPPPGMYRPPKILDFFVPVTPPGEANGRSPQLQATVEVLSPAPELIPRREASETQNDSDLKHDDSSELPVIWRQDLESDDGQGQLSRSVPDLSKIGFTEEDFSGEHMMYPTAPEPPGGDNFNIVHENDPTYEKVPITPPGKNSNADEHNRDKKKPGKNKTLPKYVYVNDVYRRLDDVLPQDRAGKTQIVLSGQTETSGHDAGHQNMDPGAQIVVQGDRPAITRISAGDAMEPLEAQTYKKNPKMEPQDRGWLARKAKGRKRNKGHIQGEGEGPRQGHMEVYAASNTADASFVSHDTAANLARPQFDLRVFEMPAPYERGSDLGVTSPSHAPPPQRHSVDDMVVYNRTERRKHYRGRQSIFPFLVGSTIPLADSDGAAADQEAPYSASKKSFKDTVRVSGANVQYNRALPASGKGFKDTIKVTGENVHYTKLAYADSPPVAKLYPQLTNQGMASPSTNQKAGPLGTVRVIGSNVDYQRRDSAPADDSYHTYPSGRAMLENPRKDSLPAGSRSRPRYEVHVVGNETQVHYHPDIGSARRGPVPSPGGPTDYFASPGGYSTPTGQLKNYTNAEISPSGLDGIIGPYANPRWS